MTDNDVTRLEAERLRPMPKEPDVNELIREAVAVLYSAFCEADPALPRLIRKGGIPCPRCE